MTGRKFFSLLVLMGMAACDSPTEPLPEPEPENVTITFTMPWPRGAGVGVDSASITCLEGCPKRQTLTTDSLGRVTFFEVFPPLKVEARKLGYITKQADTLMNKDSVVISHVWPEEAEGTFNRLSIPEETVLHWGRIEVGNNGVRGSYRCPVVLVKEQPRREAMLNTLEHELYHAYQSGVSGGRCLISRWAGSEEAKAYIEALEDDRRAGRLFPPIDSIDHYQTAIENSAEFYAWWVWGGWDGGNHEDLCVAQARCQFMEDHYGPRPNGYP